jgi:hypothetical protein
MAAQKIIYTYSYIRIASGVIPEIGGESIGSLLPI